MNKPLQFTQYQMATVCMVVNKILVDYFAAMQFFSVEPEKFVEEWMKTHMSKPPQSFKTAIWRIFIYNLNCIRRDKS